MEFTGERLIPDDPQHRDLYWEHVARYALAATTVEGKRVLDLGCGTGYGSHLLAEAGASEVLGLDASAEALTYAQAHYAAENLQFRQGDALHTALPAHSFDVIVCFELIEHLADQEALVAEIRRLLKPGGLALLSTPDAERAEAPDNPFHVRELRRGEFLALLQPHFAQVELLAQRRFSGLAFEREGAANSAKVDSRLFAADEKKAEYWVAVCGKMMPEMSHLFEIPHYQNINEMRAHLKQRDVDIATRDRRIAALQQEVVEKAAWARELDDQVKELERNVQDRDVRLVLLEREIKYIKSSFGYRLIKKMSRGGRIIYAAGKAVGRALLGLLAVLLHLPALLVFTATCVLRLGAAFRAWRIGRGLKRLWRDEAKVASGRLPSLISQKGQPGGVSIVVPTYQGRELLAESLPPLIAEVEQGEIAMEIIVVDDASTDGTAQWLAETYPQVRVLRHEQNQGFAAAANAGMQAATHPIVYLCNSDMHIEPGAIAQATTTLWRQGAFAVASAITMADPKKIGMETGLVTGEWCGSRLLLQHKGEIGAQIRSTLYAGGGAAAFHRAAVLALGGFDRLYAPYYAEDLDLSYRAWKAGYRVLIDPQSLAKHNHRGTIGKVADAASIDRTFARNLFLFQWANLADADLQKAQASSLWKDALLNRIDDKALAAAWAMKEEVRRARRVRSARVRTDREIMEGAGRLLFDSPATVREKSATKARLKVLAVAPYCPYPPTHGGAVRMWELLTRMAKKHEVHLAAMVEREAELEYRGELEKHFARVHLHLRHAPDPAPHWWPASVAEFSSNDFRQAVERLCREELYDIVQAEYPILAHALSLGGSAKTIITEIDVFHVAYRRAVDAQRGLLNRMRSRYEWLRMFRYEAEHADRADMLLAMSEVDRLACRQMTQTPVRIVPNGVDPNRIAFQPRLARPHEVLFVGHFRHTPNVEGIRWFAEKVWPLVRDADWRARLLVVGAAPPPDVQALAHDPTIAVTGFVEDLKPLYERAACFIAPIHRGSGTRLKVLEAMAAGVPVLATTVGAEGIAGNNGEHFLLADRPQETAQACLRLLAEADLRERLAAAARKLIEERYNWDAIAEQLEQAWREVLR